MELVHARVVQNGCPQCLNALLEEAKSLGGLPLTGDVVIIPKHWLNTMCPHGRSGLKFDLLVEANSDTWSPEEEEPENSDEIELKASDSRMDATKDIGYPVREHGPYGSHPGHDDFDDESSPDGSGTY